MHDSTGILIATPLRWDEACFSVPAVRALTDAGLAGGLLCPEDQHDFWQTVCPLPLITFQEKTGARGLTGLIDTSWEASLSWDHEAAAKAFASLKIPKRLGPDLPHLNKYFTHPISGMEKPTEHRVRFFLNICEQLGLRVNNPEFFKPLEPDSPPQEHTILLCPGSDYGSSHEWPLEKWEKLCTHLLDNGKKLTIACLIGGRGLGKALAEKLNERAEFFEASPLAGTLPLLSAHELVISADSSLPHLAAHAGSTCITLFGPNEPLWKRPLGTRHQTVRKAVECSPCLSGKCLLDGRCQTELNVSSVLRAISDLGLISP